MKKGSSPTKRLIEMKKSTWAHNKKAKNVQEQTEYSLKYTTSPKKTYVMDPHEGKIDYSKAKKNAFVEDLKTQKVTQHTM